MIQRIILLLLGSIVCAIPAQAAAPPAPVPQTGQTACYKAKGSALVPCAGTGQDGDVMAGVAWPTPRFINNGDKTITDQLTGLTWTEDANPGGGFKTWQQALDFIKALNSQKHLGHDDWRLPNIKELESLATIQPNLVPWLISQGFHDVMVDYYWTSSTYAGLTANAWSIGMYSGLVASRGKGDGGYVWPLRNGRPGTLALPRTGQATCCDNTGTTAACAGTGQDGALQAGAVWPNPRFTDNADQTMTDQLTGLVWTKDGKAPGPQSCGPGTSKTGQDALDYIRCLNTNSYLGKSDWRMPNRNELSSLVNYGEANNARWLMTLGFHRVQAYSYWSSSTYATASWNFWSVNMHDGAVTSNAKKHDINVWPVRGGY